jgi:hypothetical protein
VLQVGAPLPDAAVWRAPHDRVGLRELAAGGPMLLLFYLFDWSST